MSGGDPTTLDSGAGDLDTVSGDLTGDATSVAALGHRAVAAAPDQVGAMADSVLSALGGAATGGAVLVAALGRAATLASDQLVKATGGR